MSTPVYVLHNRGMMSNGDKEEAVGPFVRKERERRGLSQRVFAMKIGTSREYLAQIEAGSPRWPKKYIAAIARELDVTETELASRAGIIRDRSLAIAESPAPYEPDDALSRIAAVLAVLPRQQDVDEVVKWVEFYRTLVEDRNRVITTLPDEDSLTSFYSLSPKSTDQW